MDPDGDILGQLSIVPKRRLVARVDNAGLLSQGRSGDAVGPQLELANIRRELRLGDVFNGSGVERSSHLARRWRRRVIVGLSMQLVQGWRHFEDGLKRASGAAATASRYHLAGGKVTVGRSEGFALVCECQEDKEEITAGDGHVDGLAVGVGGGSRRFVLLRVGGSNRQKFGRYVQISLSRLSVVLKLVVLLSAALGLRLGSSSGSVLDDASSIVVTASMIGGWWECSMTRDEALRPALGLSSGTQVRDRKYRRSCSSAFIDSIEQRSVLQIGRKSL